MAGRNFSMVEYFVRKAEKHEPRLKFKGETREQWQAWRDEALPRLLDLLGEYPEKVDLAPDVVYAVEEGDLIRERVVIDSEEFMSIPCVVMRRKDMPADGKGRAILCSHGHGQFGKEPVAGNRSTPEMEADIATFNYNYGEQMARAGYLTICPDLRVFGERADTGAADRDIVRGRDKCNVHFLRGMVMGLYTLTLNIWDMKRCVDYLETRPEVDPERIGMMGLSQGGTMTTFTSAVEPRIKAADIMGYVNPWEYFGIWRANFCGSQVVPDVYKWFDTDDIAGLIAPRPLLLEMGIHDKCFPIENLLKGYEGVKRVYEAAGVGDLLWSEVHPGPHAFAANKAFEFFDKYL